ncbi:MAG: hypothetical protein U1D98_04775 [Candidatus Gracilibacteria bacterium]|nr:hypothetical protein [Candidatus Gracilibacteria bacterium]
MKNLLMPTNKKRVNLTPSEKTYEALEALAERDGISVSSKAVELIEVAIELDEDDFLNLLAEERDKKDTKFISHEDIWSGRTMLYMGERSKMLISQNYHHQFEIKLKKQLSKNSCHLPSSLQNHSGAHSKATGS